MPSPWKFLPLAIHLLRFAAADGLVERDSPPALVGRQGAFPPLDPPRVPPPVGRLLEPLWDILNGTNTDGGETATGSVSLSTTGTAPISTGTAPISTGTAPPSTFVTSTGIYTNTSTSTPCETDPPSTPSSTPCETDSPSTPSSTPCDTDSPSTPSSTPCETDSPSTPSSTPCDTDSPSTPSSTPCDTDELPTASPTSTPSFTDPPAPISTSSVCPPKTSSSTKSCHKPTSTKSCHKPTSTKSCTCKPSISVTSSMTSEPTSSELTSTASPTCADIKGTFEDGVLPPWFLSDQVTADSQVVYNPAGNAKYAFAFIPAQGDRAQVYLDQYLPSCGQPPPVVTMKVRFQYQFTGASADCSIRPRINRGPSTYLGEVTDVGAPVGEWQSFEGETFEVQLTYDPLFTLELGCERDTAQTPAIYITDISVY